MGRILIVDDSRLTLQRYRDLFTERGHEVETADHLFIAPLMSRFRPEVLLMDVNMRTERGSDTIRILRHTNLADNTRMLLFSSMDEDELATLTEECGADGFIRKSDDMQHVAALVERWLASALQRSTNSDA